MPASTFTRRPSNAPSSSHLASSSSSATPLPSATNTTSNQMMPSNQMTAGVPVAASPAYAAAAASAGGGMSEFGSGGGSAMGTIGRAPEGSSRTNSPSLSPIIGSGQATFPSGSTVGNHSISQSFQASLMDGQSLHSATNSTFTPSNTSTYTASSISGGQHTDSSLKETFSRRIRSLIYLKRCLSIVSYPSMTQGSNIANTPAWLDVIKISKRDLEVIYESEKMRKRTSRNHTLGCSIAPTLDYNSSAEFARAVLAIFNEVETMGEGGEKDKAKMRNFFKSSVRGTRRGMAGMDWDGGMGNAGMGPAMSGLDLLGSQVPFPLDFFQTTITLCDIFVEMYHKFTFFLTHGKDVGTWSSSMAKDEGNFDVHHASVTASTLDLLNKIDGKVKKLLAQTCKELDSLARHVIREELATIDPLMARELGLAEGNSGHIGMEGISHHQTVE